MEHRIYTEEEIDDEGFPTRAFWECSCGRSGSADPYADAHELHIDFDDPNTRVVYTSRPL